MTSEQRHWYDIVYQNTVPWNIDPKRTLMRMLIRKIEMFEVRPIFILKCYMEKRHNE